MYSKRKYFVNYIHLHENAKVSSMKDNTPYLVYADMYGLTYPLALYRHLTTKGVVITLCLLKHTKDGELIFADESSEFIAERITINDNLLTDLDTLMKTDEYVFSGLNEVFLGKSESILNYSIGDFIKFMVAFHDYIYAQTAYDTVSKKYFEIDTEKLKAFINIF